MADWKKFKFRITGKSGDEAITPLTMPMARLAEYLADLADVLGNKADVHLVSVEDGSASPLIYMRPSVVNSAITRMRDAKKGIGPKDAVEGWKRTNERLRADSGFADVLDADANDAEVIEFPGSKLPKRLAVSNIREQASVTGNLRRIGGKDKSIHLWIVRADGEDVFAECDETFAKQLENEHRLFSYIRVNGIATWSRDEFGNWKLDKFRAQSYDQEPLLDEPFGDTMNRLKSLPGNKWAASDDPFADLNRIRDGGDEPKQ